METRFSYRLERFYLPAVMAADVLLGAFAVLALAATFIRPDPSLLFLVFVVAWASYWLLYRVAYELEAADGRLRWKAPLTSGEVPLDALVGIRPMRASSSIQVIDTSTGPVMVWVRKGFREFAEALAAERPGLEVRLGLVARLEDRAPFGRSKFNSTREE